MESRKSKTAARKDTIRLSVSPEVNRASRVENEHGVLSSALDIRRHYTIKIPSNELRRQIVQKLDDVIGRRSLERADARIVSSKVLVLLSHTGPMPSISFRAAQTDLNRLSPVSNGTVTARTQSRALREFDVKNVIELQRPVHETSDKVNKRVWNHNILKMSADRTPVEWDFGILSIATDGRIFAGGDHFLLDLPEVKEVYHKRDNLKGVYREESSQVVHHTGIIYRNDSGPSLRAEAVTISDSITSTSGSIQSRSCADLRDPVTAQRQKPNVQSEAVIFNHLTNASVVLPMSVGDPGLKTGIESWGYAERAVHALFGSVLDDSCVHGFKKGLVFQVVCSPGTINISSKLLYKLNWTNESLLQQEVPSAALALVKGEEFSKLLFPTTVPGADDGSDDIVVPPALVLDDKIKELITASPNVLQLSLKTTCRNCKWLLNQEHLTAVDPVHASDYGRLASHLSIHAIVDKINNIFAKKEERYVAFQAEACVEVEVTYK